MALDLRKSKLKINNRQSVLQYVSVEKYLKC
jgi:hypothetical protein